MDEQVLEPELVELQDEIRNSAGQLVLIIRHFESKTRGSGGCFGVDWYYHREYQRWLGVLGPEAATFDLQTADSLPTSEYVAEVDFRQITYKPVEWTHYGRGFPIVQALREPVGYHNGYDRRINGDDRTLEIIVGAEAAMAWVSDISKLTLATEHDRLWLQRAAERLGRPFAESPELVAHHDRERQQVLDSLWNINAELEPYARQLQALKKAKETTGLVMRGGALSVVEDEDDLRVYSMGPRRQMDQLLGRLKSQLEWADELGLGEHPYVLAFRHRYFAPDAIDG